MTDTSAAPPAAKPRPIAGFFRMIGGVIKSYLTAPDGESYAPGRLMAFATFVICQCLVIKATLSVMAAAPKVADWNAFFQGVSMFEFAVATISIALVMGIAPADSGGKWWGKDASPPPPPSGPGS